jgi:glycosyltransferase involved in cell wall biosynthesis
MKELSISYLIGTHNEGVGYLKPLLTNLIKYKHENDEIIIVDDYSDDQSTLDVFEEFKQYIKVISKKFEGDFAAHKNFMIEQCSGDFILNIDADELPSVQLLSTIKELILLNDGVDLFYVPRVNVVKGLTEEDKNKWGWTLNEKGWIQYPDYQGRIFKRSQNIRWEGVVHERIVGSLKHSLLPAYDETNSPSTDYALLHIKDIDRQRNQNALYDQIQK